MEFYEKPVKKETFYEGIIVNVRRDVAELVNGKQVYREVVEHPGGVVILPVDEEGNAYMVRQFRYPFMRELLEAPAGKLEKDEEPLSCAIRELKEETGFTAGEIIDFGPIFTSPGFCEEALYIYLATKLQAGEMCLDEDEFLNVEKQPLDSLIEEIMQGRICDAKTIAVLFKAREYLKGKAAKQP